MFWFCLFFFYSRFLVGWFGFFTSPLNYGSSSGHEWSQSNWMVFTCAFCTTVHRFLWARTISIFSSQLSNGWSFLCLLVWFLNCSNWHNRNQYLCAIFQPDNNRRFTNEILWSFLCLSKLSDNRPYATDVLFIFVLRISIFLIVIVWLIANLFSALPISLFFSLPVVGLCSFAIRYCYLFFIELYDKTINIIERESWWHRTEYIRQWMHNFDFEFRSSIQTNKWKSSKKQKHVH